MDKPVMEDNHPQMRWIAKEEGLSVWCITEHLENLLQPIMPVLLPASLGVVYFVG